MSELREFLDMGGYATYVWSSYGLTLLVIGGIVWWSALELRRTREETLGRARVRPPRQRPGRQDGPRSGRSPERPGGREPARSAGRESRDGTAPPGSDS